MARRPNLNAILQAIGPDLGAVLPAVANQINPGRMGNVGASSGAGQGADIMNALLSQGSQDQPPQPIDTLQSVLDVIGVLDPTPTADAINAAISLVRAGKAATQQERAMHVQNAIISGVSMIPYIGDTAKLAKVGRKFGTAGAPTPPPVSASSIPTPPPVVRPPAASQAASASSDPYINRLASGRSGPSPPGSSNTSAEAQPHVSPARQAAANPLPPPPPGSASTPPPGVSPQSAPAQSPPVSSPPPPPQQHSRGPSGGSGSAPAPPNNWLLPLGIGVGAGATFGMVASAGSPRDLPPRRYGLWSELAGPEKAAIGADMGRFGERGAEMMKTLLDPFENPLRKVTTSMKALADTVIELPGAIRHWGDALTESQRHLRDFNGVIAYAMLESERREIVRNIAIGGRTGASTANLTKALDDLKDEVQPYKDLITNGFNNVVALLAVIMTNTIKAGTTMADIAARLAGYGVVVDLIKKWLGGNPGQPVNTPGYDLMNFFRHLPKGPHTKPPGWP